MRSIPEDVLSLPCLSSGYFFCPYYALPCLALPCLALPCLALPCLALPQVPLCCLTLYFHLLTPFHSIDRVPCLHIPCLFDSYCIDQAPGLMVKGAAIRTRTGAERGTETEKGEEMPRGPRTTTGRTAGAGEVEWGGGGNAE